jgi:putative endonuclease
MAAFSPRKRQPIASTLLITRVHGRARPGHPRDCRGDLASPHYSHGGWLGLLSTNRPNGTLYVGVTDNLARRIWERREGLVEGFTKRYGLKRLVYAEHHGDIRVARQREQNIKHYPRAWKVRLIVDNPNWEDLYDRLA